MSTFTLQLDTVAPNVTWGAQAGTTAGELLQLAYATDEAIDNADLVLSDRTLALADDGSILSVLLPVDAPNGPATVIVRDDVGNASTYAALVLIAGVIVVVPPPEVRPRTGPPPSRRSSPRSRVVQVRVRVLSRTKHVVSAEQYCSSSTTSSTSSIVYSQRLATALSELAVTSRLRTRVRSRPASATPGLELAITRRDGPDLEEMLLLGVL